jgi:hypothetical protein
LQLFVSSADAWLAAALSLGVAAVAEVRATRGAVDASTQAVGLAPQLMSRLLPPALVALLPSMLRPFSACAPAD